MWEKIFAVIVGVMSLVYFVDPPWAMNIFVRAFELACCVFLISLVFKIFKKNR